MSAGFSARSRFEPTTVPDTGQKISLAAFTDSTAPHSSANTQDVSVAHSE